MAYPTPRREMHAGIGKESHGLRATVRKSRGENNGDILNTAAICERIKCCWRCKGVHAFRMRLNAEEILFAMRKGRSDECSPPGNARSEKPRSRSNPSCNLSSILCDRMSKESNVRGTAGLGPKHSSLISIWSEPCRS